MAEYNFLFIMCYAYYELIYRNERRVRALELPSTVGPYVLINESQGGSSRDPAPMAACPGAWQRERETGESRRTCHTPKFQNREIFRQSGVGTFPWSVEMLRLLCNVSENRIMELFRSHGATYRGAKERKPKSWNEPKFCLSFFLLN